MRSRNRAPSPGTLPGLLSIALLISSVSPIALAQDPGILLGRVLDSNGAPLADACVELTSADDRIKLATGSKTDGSFALGGIPPGRHDLCINYPGFEPAAERDIKFEESSILFVRVSLAANGTALDAGPSLCWIDLTDSTSRTLIDASQVQSLPSANNLWSLIENQDFSATTNRIDVGGVWADVPALWSSRGSVSWTQSSYLINGLDATDPYATGTPLYYPDLEAIQSVLSGNARQPIEYLSPGGVLNLVPKQGTSDSHGAISLFFTGPGMTAGSVPQRLQEEGLSERTRLNSLANISAQFSGPVFTEKLLVFSSLAHLNVSRDIAEFGPDDKGTVSSARAKLPPTFLDRPGGPSSNGRSREGCAFLGDA